MKRASFLSTIFAAMSWVVPMLLYTSVFAQKTAAAARIGGQAQVSFSLERPGLPVPKFVLDVDESGRGTYHAQVADRPDSPTSGDETVTQPVQLSTASLGLVFTTARSLNFFRYPCDYKKHNIANQGVKKLAYSGPDGTGECVYNWSENRQLQKLTNLFLGIAFTLDEGRKLRMLHAYDRLGLDAEMQTLAQQARSGNALELANIRDVLQNIADDPGVIQRVRTQAAELLEQATR